MPSAHDYTCRLLLSDLMNIHAYTNHCAHIEVKDIGLEYGLTVINPIWGGGGEVKLPPPPDFC